MRDLLRLFFFVEMMPLAGLCRVVALSLVMSTVTVVCDPIGTEPRAMCDRHEMCIALVHDDDIRRLTCSLVKTCYVAPTFDCHADPSFLLKYGCAELDCAEVLPFATSLQECAFWYPPVRNAPYINLVNMRRSNPGVIAGRKAYAAAKG